MADDRYHPPVKRSVEIAGHKTSISLEPLFWELLKQAAEHERVPLNALVARIDAERIAAPTPPGLASAIRVWLVVRMNEQGGKPQQNQDFRRGRPIQRDHRAIEAPKVRKLDVERWAYIGFAKPSELEEDNDEE